MVIVPCKDASLQTTAPGAIVILQKKQKKTLENSSIESIEK